ncbi:Presenilin-1 [Phytophthora nicotianae]|uniref:Presenilin-1 n=1 Tax=Phytophthora nicotianae TaxID=4792 RepID=A0A0W8C6W5_PHYNI|nr:Presenilin-1 [Phytophthora nicotianae]
MGIVNSLWSSGETCDLSEEQIEEIHMITSLPPKEIHRIRRKYQTMVKSEDMTRDEFYALPAIAVNPLRDQLFKSLELTATQAITFAVSTSYTCLDQDHQEFAKFVQIFSYSSSQDTKLKEAFKLHDFDGDGKISRDDLRAYCALVFPKILESDSDAIRSQQEVMETLIEHVMDEASSAPSRDFLIYDDFVKVRGEEGAMPTDNTALLAGGNYDKLTTPNGGDTPAPGRQSASQPPPNEQSEQEPTAPQGEGYDDLMHGINSFWAIVFPVCVTMIVASLVVVNYRSDSIEASMSSYLVYGDSNSSSSSGGSGIGESLVNALVIIGAIAVLTFGMALLYKYNCMKFLSGYIMFASTAILSFVGGQLVDEIVNDQFGWAVDWPTFLFVMINFGFVGVISIFYQKGTPKFVQNGYLVMVSVILAWQFSMWPEWTTFTFCVMFACYDLCAVLTPCGPLKYLIGLIQEKQAPLPGLLYEADVRDGVSHNHHRQQQQRQQQEQEQRRPKNTPTDEVTATEHSSPIPVMSSSSRPRNVAESNFTTYECETIEALVALLTEFYETFSPEDTWKAPQVAEKFFPTQDRLWLLIFHKYYVCSCSMDMPCPVQARRDRRQRQREEEGEDDKTIKLGLGDFIFYSVLVGRAAIKDFSTFAVTFVCIVMGLGGTLFLLAVLHKALPALPISIFLATIFYFLTDYIFIDFCSFMMAFPAAV